MLRRGEDVMVQQLWMFLCQSENNRYNWMKNIDEKSTASISTADQ
jgi:hypothetical protein